MTQIVKIEIYDTQNQLANYISKEYGFEQDT